MGAAEGKELPTSANFGASSMSEATFGRMVLETARGADRERRVSAAETRQVISEIAERVSPKIDNIRTEQRRAFEDTKSVVVF